MPADGFVFAYAGESESAVIRQYRQLLFNRLESEFRVPERNNALE